MHAFDHLSLDSRRKVLYFALLIFLIISSFALCGCGGGSGGGGGGTFVDVNTLDGKTDIATNSNFRYTFNGPPSAATVTTTSYFIVPTPTTGAAAQVAKATYDPTICNSDNAIGATVSAASTHADLEPSHALSGSTEYTVCLSSDIMVGTQAFSGFMATFTTAGGSTPQTDRLRVINNCSYTIWIQQQNMPASTPEVVKLVAGAHQDYAIPDAGQASTRFWPKTGCDSTGQNCTIGQSSDPCTNCPPPVDSKLESTWGCTLSDQTQCGITPQGDPIGDTFWNMSAVDGYTLPFTTAITGNTITTRCPLPRLSPATRLPIRALPASRSTVPSSPSADVRRTST
jgi:hypothetical protein